MYFQVNGKDVSNLAHEEAVNEFLKAPEPILVEVKRRNGPSNDQQQQQQQQQPLQSPLTIDNETSAAITSIGQPTSPSSTNKLPSMVTATATSLTTSAMSVQQQRCNDTTSIGVQTDIMPNFDNEYLFGGSHESPTSDEHHLNSQTMPNSSSSRHGHHHHHHCNMLNECIVPPDIDIEVKCSVYFFSFLIFWSSVLVVCAGLWDTCSSNFGMLHGWNSAKCESEWMV